VLGERRHQPFGDGEEKGFVMPPADKLQADR
jgi:hypothetical protein